MTSEYNLPSHQLVDLLSTLRSLDIFHTAMFDISLRPLKDRVFDPICTVVPTAITPLHITLFAFLSGICSCIAAAWGSPWWSVVLWLFNRGLDCMDGAVARHRNQSSDLGGFLDLLADFIIYSAIPITCALGLPITSLGERPLWLAVSMAEATFHVNNFILFYVAAVVEKEKKAGPDRKKYAQELTSVSMRPALIEGAESGIIFTIMLARPEWTLPLCWVLAVGVAIGIVQRVTWVTSALSRV